MKISIKKLIYCRFFNCSLISKSIVFFLLTTSAINFPINVAAQKVAIRRVGIHWDKQGRPRVSFSLRDLLGGRTQEKLHSGLPQVIQVQIVAIEKGRIFGKYSRRCVTIYDLWEENFQLYVEGQSRRVVKSHKAVVRHCLDFRATALGKAKQYRKIQRFRFAVTAELNPIDRDKRRRIQHWLRGSRVTQTANDQAFFGSFVSRFVEPKRRAAERSRRFLSQWLIVPKHRGSMW